MNIHERRRRATCSIASISEVVADILQEAKDNNEGGLSAATINTRTGPENWDRQYQIVLGVLGLLSDNGIAVDDQPGLGHAAWRLK